VISVIIPTLDEAEQLPETLAAVGRPEGIEIIVVDGGSTDGTVPLAEAAGARVVVAETRGRSSQMNWGAAAARGDVLIFLHADTRLPEDWAPAVTRAMAQVGVVGGAFRRRFAPESWFLRATCVLADLRGRWWGWFLGDQAMFVARDDFEMLGGFAPLRACEDLDFSRRLRRVGRTVLLRETVHTSDRRFRCRGAVRQTLADLATVARFLRNPAAFR
jgi:rSAM/selenodomain-associated transferase 2